MDRTICGVCGSWLGDDELIALRKEVEKIRRNVNTIIKERDDALESIPFLLKAASDMEEQRDEQALAFNIAFEQGKRLAQERDEAQKSDAESLALYRSARDRADAAIAENERLRELLNAIPDSILRDSYYGSTQWGTDIRMWKAVSVWKERQ